MNNNIELLNFINKTSASGMQRADQIMKSKGKLKGLVMPPKSTKMFGKKPKTLKMGSFSQGQIEEMEKIAISMAQLGQGWNVFKTIAKPVAKSVATGAVNVGKHVARKGMDAAKPLAKKLWGTAGTAAAKNVPAVAGTGVLGKATQGVAWAKKNPLLIAGGAIGTNMALDKYKYMTSPMKTNNIQFGAGVGKTLKGVAGAFGKGTAAPALPQMPQMPKQINLDRL